MKYLYCVIPKNGHEKLDVQGIGGKVYTIPYEDVSLVVSDTEPIPFTSIRKEELVKYLLTHQSTIEKIMFENSVVPLKFGTFFEEEETQRIIRKGYKLFKESLENVSGKVEFDLVANWSDMGAILAEIGQMEEIRKLKQEVCQRPLEERTRGSIELGMMVKACLDKKKEKIAREIIIALKDKVHTFCEHQVLDENMIFNVAFLIDKDKRVEFEKELDNLDKNYEGKLKFKLVGPLPPYSFNMLEVKKIDPEDLAYAKAVLGIMEEHTPEEIKNVYRTMAQKLHPDKNLDNPEAAKQFEELKRAFDLLYEYSSNGRDLLSVKKYHGNN